MPGSVQRATVVRFSLARGGGALRLADGREVAFTEDVARAPAAALDPDAPVWAEAIPWLAPGGLRIVRVELDAGEAAPPWSPRPWTASPEEALALLRSAGLADGIDAPTYRASCLQVARAALADAMDPRDLDAMVRVDAIDPQVALAGLAALLGGPGAGPAFVVPAAPDVAAVRATLERWLGERLSLEAASFDALVADAADVLFLRRHVAGEGPEIFTLAGALHPGGRFRVVAIGTASAALGELGALGRPVRPETEAAAAGVFRAGARTRAFAAHASGCSRCRTNLWREAAAGRLPKDFVGLA